MGILDIVTRDDPKRICKDERHVKAGEVLVLPSGELQEIKRIKRHRRRTLFELDDGSTFIWPEYCPVVIQAQGHYTGIGSVVTNSSVTGRVWRIRKGDSR